MRHTGILLILVTFAVVQTPAQDGSGPGDGGPASGARLEFPLGLALGSDGALYVSERQGNRVRMVDPSTGIIETVAGTGERGFGGDGGPASKALIACPDSIDIDTIGNLYIADRCNHRIRRVDSTSGIITTVAGTGEHEASPDGIAAESSLMGPYYVRSLSPGKLLYTDTDSDRVRIIDLESGRVTTVAGSGERGFAGDGGPALAAMFARPHVALFDRGRGSDHRRLVQSTNTESGSRVGNGEHDCRQRGEGVPRPTARPPSRLRSDISARSMRWRTATCCSPNG